MSRLKTAALTATVALGVLAGVAGQASAQVTAYEGARVIVGDGRVLDNTTLVVDGTKLTQVGGAAPAGANRVNLAGKTVMPMFLDTHVHLSPTRDGVVRDLKQRAYFGVGAAMSMGTDSYDVLDLRDKDTPGMARFLSAGKGLSRNEGRPTLEINSVEEARKAVQTNAAHKVNIIKVWVDDRDGKVDKVLPSQYEAAIDEAHKNGLRVTAHIFNEEDGKRLIRAGVDAFAHSVRDKDIDDEMLALYKSKPNLVVNPNLPDRGVKQDLSWLKSSLPSAEYAKLAEGNTDRPKAQGAYGIQARNLAKINAAGVEDRAGDGWQSPLGPPRGGGRHGGRRHDPGAGHHGRDQERGRVPQAGRHRHARSRQERRLHRARREPARRHHQHAQDLPGDPARCAGGSLEVSAMI